MIKNKQNTTTDNIGIYAADGLTPLFEDDGRLNSKGEEIHSNGILVTMYSMGGNTADLIINTTYSSPRHIAAYRQYSQKLGLTEVVGCADMQHIWNIIRAYPAETLARAIGKTNASIVRTSNQDWQTYIQQIDTGLIGSQPFDADNERLNGKISAKLLTIILNKFTALGVVDKEAYCLIAACCRGLIKDVSALNFINSHWFESWEDGWKQDIVDYINSNVKSWQALYAIFLYENGITQINLNTSKFQKKASINQITAFGKHGNWAKAILSSEHKAARQIYIYQTVKKGAGSALGPSLQRAIETYSNTQEYLINYNYALDKTFCKEWTMFCSQLYQDAEVQMGLFLHMIHSADGKMPFFNYPRAWKWVNEKSEQLEGFSIFNFFTYLKLNVGYVVIREHEPSASPMPKVVDLDNNKNKAHQSKPRFDIERNPSHAQEDTAPTPQLESKIPAHHHQDPTFTSTSFTEYDVCAELKKIADLWEHAARAREKVLDAITRSKSKKNSSIDGSLILTTNTTSINKPDSSSVSAVKI